MADVENYRAEDASEEKKSDEKGYVSPVPSETLSIVLDSDGLPLIPQPSKSPADPLNYPKWLKMTILLQVSVYAMISVLHLGIINPAYLPLSEDLHVTVTQASIQSTLGLATGGIAPLIWIPIANVYGRRPVYLTTALMQAVFAFASARVKSFTPLLIIRTFIGLFTGVPQALGAGTVIDLFFLHERGVKMGIYTVFLNSGGHTAALLGGYLGQFISWRWCYYMAAILSLTMFFIMLFALPETIHSRDPRAAQSYSGSEAPSETDMWLRKLNPFWGHRVPGRRVRLIDCIRPFEMALYPAVLIPALCYSVAFCFGSIEPAVTIAVLFAKTYHFKPGHIGLLGGVSTLAGSIAGELVAGKLIDVLMQRARKKSGGEPVPESRLHGVWSGAVAYCAGLLIYGFAVQHDASFVVACLGDALASFGVQTISTVCYAYISDCYKPQTSESSQLINFVRNELGFTLGFYSIPFGTRFGYDKSFLTYTLIWLFVFFAPMIWLMRYGKAIRERRGVPKWNHDI